VSPDDEVYRVNTVWLGPRGLTLPWTARYQAYGVWLGMFVLVLAVEALTPITMGVPPVWEACATTLATYAVMSFVDYERPVVAVWQMFAADLRAPRPVGDVRPVAVTAGHVKVRAGRGAAHARARAGRRGMASRARPGRRRGA
jgi:hypothetical protein